MIEIMGVTGKTEGRVAEVLLARGEKVRVIGRDREKLQALVDLGAEAAVGDVTERAFLTQAFAGVEAACTTPICANFKIALAKPRHKRWRRTR